LGTVIIFDAFVAVGISFGIFGIDVGFLGTRVGVGLILGASVDSLEVLHPAKKKTNNTQNIKLNLCKSVIDSTFISFSLYQRILLEFTYSLLPKKS
jgi:hypothetical protein